MSTSDAINIAKKMKQTFKAFEDAEILLLELNSAESRKISLTKDNDKLAEKKAELEISVQDLHEKIRKLAEDSKKAEIHLTEVKLNIRENVDEEIQLGKKKLAEGLAEGKKELEEFLQEKAKMQEITLTEHEDILNACELAQAKYDEILENIKKLKESL
jgi:hypothetical protein